MPGASPLVAAAHAVMGCYCALGAYVQWNDPDPEVWITTYAACAAVCCAAAADARADSLR